MLKSIDIQWDKKERDVQHWRGTCCLANCDRQLSFRPTRATCGIDFFFDCDYTGAPYPWPTKNTFLFLRCFLVFSFAVLSEQIILYFVNLRETWERSGSFGFRVSMSSLAVQIITFADHHLCLFELVTLLAKTHLFAIEWQLSASFLT